MKKIYLTPENIERRIDSALDKTFVCVFSHDNKMIEHESYNSYDEAVEAFEEVKKEYLSKDEFYKIVVVKMTRDRMGLPDEEAPVDFINLPYNKFLKAEVDQDGMYFKYSLADFCLCENNQDKKDHSDFSKFYKNYQK